MGLCQRCCSTFSSTILIVLNVVTLLGGLFLLGIGAYGYVERAQLGDAFGLGDAQIGPSAIGVMVLGGLVFLVSILGCQGARKEHRCMLGTYLFFMVIFAAIQIALASSFFVFVGHLEHVSSTSSVGITGIPATLNDYQLAIYNKCCTDVYPTTVTPAYTCTSAPCGGNDNDCACIINEDDYNKVYEDTSLQGVCNLFSNTTISYDGNQVPVVGNPEPTNGCGDGEPKTFQEYMYIVFEVYSKPIGWTLMSIAIIEMFAILLGCSLMCCGGSSRPKSGSFEGEEDRLVEA